MTMLSMHLTAISEIMKVECNCTNPNPSNQYYYGFNLVILLNVPH